MDDDEVELVLRLATVPGRGPGLTRPEFEAALAGRGHPDVEAWARAELDKAGRRLDADGVELAVMAAPPDPLPARWVPLVAGLLEQDWHHSHEDLVRRLERTEGAGAVPALLAATTWEPAYLSDVTPGSLTRAVVHALGRIPGPKADQALRSLQRHPDDPVRRLAAELLERRG